jgi:hypothetical protein
MTKENQTQKITILCPDKDCLQKLALPKTMRSLRVTCPKCKTSFIYPKQTTLQKTRARLINKVKLYPIFLGIILTVWLTLVANWYSKGALTLSNGSLSAAALIIFWVFGTWIIDKLTEEETKWYYQKWFVVLMLLLFTPLGITLLWAGSKFKRPAKIGLTIVFGVGCVVWILTQTPKRFYSSPQEEIADLIGSGEDGIFLKSVSNYTKTAFQKEILSRKISALAKPSTIPKIAKKWGKSIVLVRSKDQNGYGIAQGSGFVLTKSGAIITNYHVVESAHNVSIEFIDGQSYQKILLIAGYPHKDIAILHIDAEDKLFIPVTLGDSNEVEVGERVLAIGNPLGWENTLSDGLISGIREIGSTRLLQISAPISPGSSGGALFSMNGRVIGIITLGSSWAAQNLNFAIPINSVISAIAKNFE